MNKLISKNPVQRFKEGKKIVKAQWGTYMGVPNQMSDYMYRMNWPSDTPLPGGMYLDNSNGAIYNTSPRVISSPKVIQNGTYYETKKGNALIDSGRYYGGKKVSMPIALGSYYEKKDSNGNIIERGRYVGSKQQTFQNNQETQNSKKIETTSKQNIPNSKNKRPLTTNNRIISKYSNRKSELGGKSVKDWQNILKKYYAPGTYKNDGIWGDNTEEAYRKYLTIANTDFAPVSKEPVAIPNNENNNVNFNYEKFKKAALASDYTPDSIEQKLVTTPITYNRSMTRDWLRNNIGTAYGVSGAMRAAARRKLNGQATDNDIALIKSNQKLYDALKNAGLFKKGGQLPSRNVVERFKNRI